MPEHLGTHMDAPSHINYDHFSSWSVDEIPVDNLIGPCVVIDISDRAWTDPDTEVQVSDLIKWEDKHGRILPGSIILMNSGWEKKWEQGITEYLGNHKVASEYHFPGFSKEAADWLVTYRDINGVGVDTLSIDSGIHNKNKDAHLIFFTKNKYGLENVHNMANVPEHGAMLYVFPMNIKDGSGGPTRVVAQYWPEKETPVYNGQDNLQFTVYLILAPVLLAFWDYSQ